MSNLVSKVSASFGIPARAFPEAVGLLRSNVPAAIVEEVLVIGPSPRATLEATFIRAGWPLRFDADGNVSGLGDVDIYLDPAPLLFRALAPCVAPGSWIEFIQSYGSGHPNRWLFDGRELRWVDLTPSAVVEAQAEKQRRIEIFRKAEAERRRRGEMPHCQSCAVEDRTTLLVVVPTPPGYHGVAVSCPIHKLVMLPPPDHLPAHLQ